MDQVRKIVNNPAWLASLYAIGVVLTQVMNVKQVGVIGPTLFGTTSHGIWISTIELQLMVLLQLLLGPFAALGVIFTSFAFSLAVSAPSFVMATVLSKVFALAGTVGVFHLTKKWKTRHRLNAAFFTALQLDVLAFALLAGIPEIIQTSLLIRTVLHATTMAIVYGFIRKEKDDDSSC